MSACPGLASRLSVAALVLLLASGCASQPAQLDNPEIDPWEPFNRKVHGFNEGFDKAIARPVATAYDKVMPDAPQRAPEDRRTQARCGSSGDSLPSPVATTEPSGLAPTPPPGCGARGDVRSACSAAVWRRDDGGVRLVPPPLRGASARGDCLRSALGSLRDT